MADNGPPLGELGISQKDIGLDNQNPAPLPEKSASKITRFFQSKFGQNNSNEKSLDHLKTTNVLPKNDIDPIKVWEQNVKLSLTNYGLNSDDLIAAWQTTREKDKALNYEPHLQAIAELEKERPGIVKVLNQEFGIKHFGRYPKEMLIRQYDEKDNTDSPYGIILYPQSDRNGGFLLNKDPFANLYNLVRTDGKYEIRVTEAESKIDIARRLLELNRKYGAKHKIAFAIIGGHGEKDSIQFGGEDSRHQLHTEDLKGRGIGRANEFFEPRPTIILASCSTGESGGIAQELSRVMNAQVIAPEAPTNILNFSLNTEYGLDLKASYRDRYAKRTFFSGRRIY